MTGIGGVFFESRSDPERLAAWYRDNLGVPVEAWGGAVLRWSADAMKDGGATAWHVAARTVCFCDAVVAIAVPRMVFEGSPSRRRAAKR
ncbi:MAG TPA: hypothetical protein VHJ20_13470 [Polyangia bacterium]|nr:hypothetical protein [Polyangia bacterium]